MFGWIGCLLIIKKKEEEILIFNYISHCKNICFFFLLSYFIFLTLIKLIASSMSSLRALKSLVFETFIGTWIFSPINRFCNPSLSHYFILLPYTNFLIKPSESWMESYCFLWNERTNYNNSSILYSSRYPFVIIKFRILSNSGFAKISSL